MHLCLVFSRILIGALISVQHVAALEYVFTRVDAPFPGRPETRPQDINDSGQIVGDTPFRQAFLISEGQYTTIDLPSPVLHRARQQKRLGSITVHK